MGEYRADLLQPQQEIRVSEDQGKRLKELLAGLHMKVSIKGSDTQLAMYPFLKLLSQKELNRLLHQFIRFRTSLENSSMKENAPEAVLNGEIEKLIALVEFTTQPLANTVSYRKVVETHFQSFIEGDIKEYVNLYYQSDQEHSVLHRNIVNMSSTGVMALYGSIFKNSYQVKKIDYAAYIDAKNTKEVGKQFTKIGEDQKRLQELHEKLVDKNGDKRQLQEYKNLLYKVHKYNNLRKKITFESMYEIYQIHTEILGRLASFAEDWERDMLFMLTALERKRLIEISVNDIFDKGRIIGKMKQELKGKEKLLKSLYCLETVSSEEFWRLLNVRNSVAHLNHFTQKAQGNKKNLIYQKSIEELINRVRSLLSYDMKRQNAVTQAIQKIFDKHQIMIKFKPKLWDEKKGVEFEIAIIKSKQIKHLKNLGGRAIHIESYDNHMINAVERLVKFEYNELGANQ